MAALTVTPDRYRVRETVTVNGSAFEVDTPVTVTVTGPGEAGLTATVLADGSGDFADSLSFVITHEGVWYIEADDGTNQASQQFRASYSG